MSELRHKNCDGKIILNYGDVGQPEEGECLRCGETITRSEQLKPNEVKEKEEDNKCPHKKTIAINEEGHAGVYCSDCGEQLEKEC